MRLKSNSNELIKNTKNIKFSYLLLNYILKFNYKKYKIKDFNMKILYSITIFLLLQSSSSFAYRTRRYIQKRMIDFF